MNSVTKKTGEYARTAREKARDFTAKSLNSNIFARPFDPVAYAAALEVLG